MSRPNFPWHLNRQEREAVPAPPGLPAKPESREERLLRIERERYEQRMRDLNAQFNATINHFGKIEQASDDYYRKRLEIANGGKPVPPAPGAPLPASGAPTPAPLPASGAPTPAPLPGPSVPRPLILGPQGPFKPRTWYPIARSVLKKSKKAAAVKKPGKKK